MRAILVFALSVAAFGQVENCTIYKQVPDVCKSICDPAVCGANPSPSLADFLYYSGTSFRNLELQTLSHRPQPKATLTAQLIPASGAWLSTNVPFYSQYIEKYSGYLRNSAGVSIQDVNAFMSAFSCDPSYAGFGGTGACDAHNGAFAKVAYGAPAPSGVFSGTPFAMSLYDYDQLVGYSGGSNKITLRWGAFPNGNTLSQVNPVSATSPPTLCNQPIVKSASSTSLTIAKGAQTLTVGTGLSYTVGGPVRIVAIVDAAAYMFGSITSYDPATGIMVANIDQTFASGTAASWIVKGTPTEAQYEGCLIPLIQAMLTRYGSVVTAIQVIEEPTDGMPFIEAMLSPADVGLFIRHASAAAKAIVPGVMIGAAALGGDFSHGYWPDWTATGIVSGTYTSGITATGNAGDTCVLSPMDDGNGTSAATVALTALNTIASGTPLVITNTGYAVTRAPSSATAGNGTATCSGTATVATLMTGVPANCIAGTTCAAMDFYALDVFQSSCDVATHDYGHVLVDYQVGYLPSGHAQGKPIRVGQSDPQVWCPKSGSSSQQTSYLGQSDAIWYTSDLTRQWLIFFDRWASANLLDSVAEMFLNQPFFCISAQQGENYDNALPGTQFALTCMQELSPNINAATYKRLQASGPADLIQGPIDITGNVSITQ